MDTRSKTCRRSKSGPCSRLALHKGACRPTLTRHAPKAVVAASAKPVIVYEATVLGFHVVVLSDGTCSSTPVVESPAPIVTVPAKARKARRPKVRTLKPVLAEGRDIQTLGHARRSKAAPRVGTREVTIAESLIANPVQAQA